ncbi:hypothetical protein [Chamaesiphon sp.]|uniref:hypothetical protein n=1 Tax=Chamaesiphon sp. TaxID=2814140 RepID=UPI003594375D
MSIQSVETYQDFDLLSDEKPWIGGVIFIDNQKHIITKVLDHRVYHNVGDGDVEGFNPDLVDDQGWMRYRVIAESVD